MERGLSYEEKQQWMAAVGCFKKVAASDPSSSVALCRLGITLTHVGMLDEALISLRRATSLDPNYADAHCGLGWAFSANSQGEEEARCFRRALAIDPFNASAHWGTGDLLVKEGKYA
jgi:tetratricopeptide (TPR) repeat protein